MDSTRPVDADLSVKQEESRAFRLLVGYRWISLLPPLIWLILNRAPDPQAATWPLLGAAGLTLLLTLAARPVNRLLQEQPRLLGLDLAASAILVWATGVEASPFYLYSLAPILAAAFFFQIRGGLLAAATYALGYLVIFLLRSLEIAPNWWQAVSQLISFLAIGIAFGYPSQLLRRLRLIHEWLAAGNTEMSRRNRDLHLLDELTLVMQSSVDLAQLQETILHGLVNDMGYRRAVVGLYDESNNSLTGWLALENLPVAVGPQVVSRLEPILLEGDDGPIARALHSHQPVEVLDGQLATRSKGSRRLIAGRHYIALPLFLRENPLGIILIDHLPSDRPLPAADRSSLQRLAAHAGVTMGSVRLCINRTQREAVMQERTRIAVDLHDSISQVLYGLAYGLDACIQLVTQDPVTVEQELRKLYPVVMDAQAQMRTAIFDMRSDEITSDTFVARLHRHLHAICPSTNHALRIELPGEFDRWSSEFRSHLYRIAQEAMTNAAKHAEAGRIVVTVSPNHEQVEVRVEDDGIGFSMDGVHSAGHLGIQSMTERVERLGGHLQIESQPRQGTVVVAHVPMAQH